MPLGFVESSEEVRRAASREFGKSFDDRYCDVGVVPAFARRQRAFEFSGVICAGGSATLTRRQEPWDVIA
jgi:hypothetical protein